VSKHDSVHLCFFLYLSRIYRTNGRVQICRATLLLCQDELETILLEFLCHYVGVFAVGIVSFNRASDLESQLLIHTDCGRVSDPDL